MLLMLLLNMPLLLLQMLNDANMPDVACHLARAYASVDVASVAAGS